MPPWLFGMSANTNPVAPVNSPRGTASRKRILSYHHSDSRRDARDSRLTRGDAAAVPDDEVERVPDSRYERDALTRGVAGRDAIDERLAIRRGREIVARQRKLGGPH